MAELGATDDSNRMKRIDKMVFILSVFSVISVAR
jgi:hypothetical protein